MSWQPAFCEKKSEKPECQKEEFLDPKQYHNMNFALHGLWPNKESCGINYSFCGEEEHKGSFAAYSPLQLTNQTLSELGKVMPSVRAQSFLERHEWHKHGTCSQMKIDDYFQYAATLVEQFNALPAVQEIVQKNIGKKMNKEQFFESLNQSLHDKKTSLKATHSMIFVCNKNGQLAEIQINLKKELPINPNLQDTLDFGKKGYIRGCRNEIEIDAPGKSGK
jgi:ribonuclease T2